MQCLIIITITGDTVKSMIIQCLYIHNVNTCFKIVMNCYTINSFICNDIIDHLNDNYKLREVILNSIFL